MYFTVLKQQVLLVFINIIKGVNYYLHETLSLKIIYHNYRTSNHLKGKNTRVNLSTSQKAFNLPREMQEEFPPSSAHCQVWV